MYSPAETGWEQTMQDAWRLLNSPPGDDMGVEFTYITNHFPFTLKNVNIGESTADVYAYLFTISSAERQ